MLIWKFIFQNGWNFYLYTSRFFFKYIENVKSNSLSLIMLHHLVRVKQMLKENINTDFLFFFYTLCKHLLQYFENVFMPL